MSANYLIIFVVFNIFLVNDVKCNTPTPIVLWHGMGDSCCFPFSLGAFKDELIKEIPGLYVLSLEIGNSLVEDVTNGYFKHPNEQIQLACDIIKKDNLLKDGFNAIGFSQGSQFLRALVQRCDGINVKNLISLGGQHQGIYGLPKCGSLANNVCDYIRKLLNHAAYLSWVQKGLVQATYWHDPLHEDEYRNFSTFIAEINNELSINENYKTKLQSLEHFVMVKFENDSMVQPVDSEWFGFYAPGQSEILQRLEDSDLYKNDRLGLKAMNDNNQLVFLSTPGDHLRFEWEWFVNNIVNPYLRDSI